MSTKRFFKGIQETLSLKHIDLPHLRAPCWVSRLSHQEEKVRSDHNGVLNKFIDNDFVNLWVLFDITSRVTTNGVKIQSDPKEDQITCDKRDHSLSRTAVGKLLWMSQHRDDIKCPSKSCQDRGKSTGIRLRQPQASSQVCQSDSIRLEISSSSWTFRFQPRILKVWFPSRVSTIQTQVGQDIKHQEVLRVVH